MPRKILFSLFIVLALIAGTAAVVSLIPGTVYASNPRTELISLLLFGIVAVGALVRVWRRRKQAA